MQAASTGRGGRAGRLRPQRALPAPPAPTSLRASQLRQVTIILRKKESLRSKEEIELLSGMKDIVQEVKFRLRRRQEVIDRNKEIEDDHFVLKSKCKKLAHALEKAKHLVVYTGAGISTAADIPDYRGPNGIWTRLQQGKEIGKHDLTRADPTLTHMALWKLYKKRYLKFVVSQNCDGLHLRSGLPRRALSEVHGNMYIEICKSCKPNIQYWRLFDTTERTARYFHKTGRICHICGGSVEDSIVHFGERGVAQWPLNWTGALHHAAKADVILCLGSSLKVLKKYPWLWCMDKPINKRPAVFIVNLQWTPKDDIAALKINGRCDSVMKLVMEYLGLETPKYERQNDPIFGHTSYLTPKELHTTSQPMLVKSSITDLITEEKGNKLNSKSQNVDSDSDEDDPDDDCPLNILKLKMLTSDDPILDLRVKSFSTSDYGLIKEETKQTVNECDNLKYNLSHSLIHKVSDYNITLNETVNSHEVCTNIEKNNSLFLASDNRNILASKNLNNLNYFSFHAKMNNYMDNNLDMLKNQSCIINPNYNKYLDKPEHVINLDSDMYEKVHLEMKTYNDESCKVCILLINKSKHLENESRVMQIEDRIDNQIPDYIECFQKYGSQVEIFGKERINEVTSENDKFSVTKYSCFKENCSKLPPLIPLDLCKYFKPSQNKNNSFNLYPKIVENDRSKLYHSFKNFCKVRELCAKDFAVKDKISNLNTIFFGDVKNYPFKNEDNELESVIKGPLDYSLKKNSTMTFIKKNNKVFGSYSSRKVFSKPVIIPRIDNISLENNLVMDLSLNSDYEYLENNANFKIEESMKLNVTTSDHYLNKLKNNTNIKLVALFEKRCESFAKVIIQNTRQVNRKELQCAYSGLHSIINPKPFHTNCETRSVFNPITFIRFAQKLLLKNRANSNIKSINCDPLMKRKFQYIRRLRPRKRREPTCEFCYKHYKSYVCNFYEPYNSEKRFEKWRNGRMIMCECCDTDTSYDTGDGSCDTEDDLDLKTIKLMKNKIDDENKMSESGEAVTNMSSDDLKNSVQSSVKESNIKLNIEIGNVQAGWFGKGFRKNRRRKR